MKYQQNQNTDNKQIGQNSPNKCKNKINYNKNFCRKIMKQSLANIIKTKNNNKMNNNY